MRCFECQHFFNRLSACLFLGISLFFACQSSPDPDVVKPEKGDIETESRIEPIARPPTPEETFEQLKQENLGDILDNDFKTLRRLVASKTYLDFLRRNHPLEAQYQTYDAFWEIASAHPSRYMPFLEQTLEKPDEEDAANAHLFAVHYRHVLTRGYHGEDPDTFQDEWVKLIKGPGVDIGLKHFVDDERNALKGFEIAFLAVEIDLYVRKIEQADAAHAAELFDKYGEHETLIWIALKDPVLIGYILKDFTDVQVFQRWMAGEFHQ
ncbi:hypothetical protein C6503_01400 [Candidatus Poribacteria bacterium]|nr:MAG: hypothetical protein C6503_01400 [Candidatus Poribacteria bacterium]